MCTISILQWNFIIKPDKVFLFDKYSIQCASMFKFCIMILFQVGMLCWIFKRIKNSKVLMWKPKIEEIKIVS